MLQHTLKEAPCAFRLPNWEAFAAFVTFTSLVALAGAIYGSFRGDAYQEIQEHEELEHFLGIVNASPRLSSELDNENRRFTIIALTDRAFKNRGTPVLTGESYIISSSVFPNEIASGRELQRVSMNGQRIVFSRSESQEDVMPLVINGVAIRDRMLVDNGIIYLVDDFIYPGGGNSVASRPN